jgi:hypothetical protein
VARWLKVLIGSYAIAFSVALTLFVFALFIFGHERAMMIWDWRVLLPLWVIGLPICARYLR